MEYINTLYAVSVCSYSVAILLDTLQVLKATDL